MNDLPTAMPTRSDDRRHSARSARWTAGFVAALGFGFMGSALIDATEPAGAGIGSRPEMTAPMPAAGLGPAAGHAESPEIDQVVRHWVWETPGPAQKGSPTQDLDELWLAR